MTEQEELITSLRFDLELADKRYIEYRSECETLRVAMRVTQAANAEQRLKIAELEQKIDYIRQLCNHATSRSMIAADRDWPLEFRDGVQTVLDS